MRPAALKFLNSESIKHSVPTSKMKIVIPIQSKVDCNTDLVRQVSASSLFVMFLNDRNGEPERRGEWMGADKNSIQEFGLWTWFHSSTSASFSCQVHAATEVLLNLGASPNQQPQHTRSGNTHDTAAGSSNRLGQFLKPTRLLLLDLASHRQGKPVRLV
jgi:hypothetical protein